MDRKSAKMCGISLPKRGQKFRAPYALLLTSTQISVTGGDTLENSEKWAPQGTFSTFFSYPPKSTDFSGPKNPEVEYPPPPFFSTFSSSLRDPPHPPQKPTFFDLESPKKPCKNPEKPPCATAGHPPQVWGVGGLLRPSAD